MGLLSPIDFPQVAQAAEGLQESSKSARDAEGISRLHCISVLLADAYQDLVDFKGISLTIV